MNCRITGCDYPVGGCDGSCSSAPNPDGSPNPGVRDLSWWKRRITLSPLVKIERCTDPLMWYADRVGQEVKIEKVDRDGLWAREGGHYNAINIIRFTDV